MSLKKVNYWTDKIAEEYKKDKPDKSKIITYTEKASKLLQREKEKHATNALSQG